MAIKKITKEEKKAAPASLEALPDLYLGNISTTICISILFLCP